MSQLTYKRFRAFGVRVSKVHCPAGYKFVAVSNINADRTNAPSFTLHTHGELICRSLTDEGSVEARTPGMATPDLLPIRKGKFEFSAQVDTHWWCFAKNVNGGTLPKMSAVVLADGETRAFPVGTKLFLCDGEATANGAPITMPLSIEVKERELTVVASGAAYGFLMFVE